MFPGNTCRWSDPACPKQRTSRCSAHREAERASGLVLEWWTSAVSVSRGLWPGVAFTATRLGGAGGASRGGFGGGDQRADDPQEREEESDPEHPVVPFTECRQAEVDPARYVHDAQQNPENGHAFTVPSNRCQGSCRRPRLVEYVFAR